MEEFAITVKFTQNPKCLPSDYVDKVFSKWKQLGVIIDEVSYEADNKQICHCHGIIRIPRGLYRKKMMIYGVHFKIKELYDKQRWRNYMYKTYNLRRRVQFVNEDERNRQLSHPLMRP